MEERVKRRVEKHVYNYAEGKFRVSQSSQRKTILNTLHSLMVH